MVIIIGYLIVLVFLLSALYEQNHLKYGAGRHVHERRHASSHHRFRFFWQRHGQ